MTDVQNPNFEKYIEIRNSVRESHFMQWELLRETIEDLIKRTEDFTSDIIADVKKAYDFLEDAIIQSVFEEFHPKDFTTLEKKELSLLNEVIPQIKKMFEILLTAYLKTSKRNSPEPRDQLRKLLIKFNNENAELRYPDDTKNPYIVQYKKKNNPDQKKENDKPDQKKNFIWQISATDEFGIYYQNMLNVLNSMRDFQTHGDDPYISIRNDKIGRKLKEPVSGIRHRGNYLILCSLTILVVYTFIEILQIWIDTQIIIKKMEQQF